MTNTGHQQQQRHRHLQHRSPTCDVDGDLDDPDDGLGYLDGAPRNVRFSDKKLVHMARRATEQVDWDLLSSTMHGDEQQRQRLVNYSRWVPHKRKAVRNAATRIFTRRGSSQNPSLGVLAVTSIPCSLHELKLALETRTTEAFCDLMGVLFRADFLSGELVHTANPTEKTLTNLNLTDATGITLVPELIVTAVAFDNNGFFFGHSEEWCFLEFTQQVPLKSSSVNAFRKTLVSLHPEDCFVGKLAVSRATQGRGVIAGILLEEEPDGMTTRVAFSGEHFYSEPCSPKGLRKKSASHRTVKARLLRVAESIERLGLIIRRRRLGMQVLIDEVHVKPTNSSCIGCKKSFLFTRKKLCNLCGYNVCERCSAMEDRERRALCSGRPWIVRVRICGKCITCVDQSRYLNMTVEDLKPAGVVPDPSPREPLGAMLTSLLQTKLSEAKCESEKASVFRLIKTMVDQEKSFSSSSSSCSSSCSSGTPRTPIVLTDSSCEADHFRVLQAKLNAEPVPSLDECVVSDNEKRRYRNEHPLDPVGDVKYVIPPNEAKRLEVIRSNKFAEMENIPELELICSIVGRELGCVGAMVTVVEEDYFHVIATDLEIPTRNFPRHEGFCSRAILDDKPLLVPHLQADVRFSYMDAVNNQHLRFYCGFPLFSEDFTVIGTLCCAGLNTHKLTQSEFVIAQKLAETTSKILQRQVKARAAKAAAAAVTGP